MILDRIFVTEDNFNYLYKNEYVFITALAAGRTEAKNSRCKQTGVRKVANRFVPYGVYGIKQQVALYGYVLWVRIYFDADKQVFDEILLFLRIECLEVELKVLGKQCKLVKWFGDYFVVGMSVVGEFCCVLVGFWWMGGWVGLGFLYSW